MNKIKVLRCRFQQCLCTFKLLLVEASCETGLFRHLSGYVFGVCNFEKTKSMRIIFLSKYLKLHVDFKNAAKNWEKMFFLWDNCIWIGTVKLSLLRTGYFSSARNMLTRRPKVLHVNKADFFQLNWIESDQWICKMYCDVDFNRAWARLPCCSLNCCLKRDFLDIYQTRSSESIIAEMKKLWGSSFLSKYSKVKVLFQKPEKKFEKVSCFRHNCIWSGIVKLSLLRTGYLSSVANVLRSSPRFSMWIRGTFYNSVSLPVTKEYEQGTVMQISTELVQV